LGMCPRHLWAQVVNSIVRQCINVRMTLQLGCSGQGFLSPLSSTSRINVKIAWSMYAKFRLGVSLHMQTKSNASIHRLIIVPLFRAIWQVCEICGNFLLISSHGLFEHRRCLTKMLPQNPRFRRDITNNLYLHRSYITTMVVNRISRCLKYLVAEPL